MLTIRPIRREDHAAWLPLWEGYNAFYERVGPTALDPAVTAMTWARFFDPYEPVHALVAEQEGRLLGLTHFVYHRTTTAIAPNCYLHDLFTVPESRGQGVGRALIEAVAARAKADGAARVYWQTQTTNTAGRLLYDKVAKHLGFIVYTRFL